MFYVKCCVVKNCKKIIRKDSYLIDDLATFENILLHRDEAMVQLKFYNLA